MSAFVIHLDDGEVWVRREDQGCILFSKGKYAEGNETAYQILKLMADGLEVNEIPKALAEQYNEDEATIRSGMVAMFQTFAESGWFEHIWRELNEGVSSATASPGSGSAD